MTHVTEQGSVCSCVRAAPFHRHVPDFRGLHHCEEVEAEQAEEDMEEAVHHLRLLAPLCLLLLLVCVCVCGFRYGLLPWCDLPVFISCRGAAVAPPPPPVVMLQVSGVYSWHICPDAVRK